MIQLIAKDVRLTLDAILIWIAAAIGITSLIAVAGTAFPGVASISFADAMNALSFLLWISVAPTAALITVAVLHGDHRHHASAFAASLPTGDLHRLIARGSAILMAASIPLVVAILFDLLRSSDQAGGRTFGSVTSIIGAMVAAIGYASVTASFTSRLIEAWAWVVALAAGSALFGALGAAAGLCVARGEELLLLQEHSTSANGLVAAVTVGGFAAAKCVGFLALGCAAATHLTEFRVRRTWATFLVAGLIASLVGAEVAQLIGPLLSSELRP